MFGKRLSALKNKATMSSLPAQRIKGAISPGSPENAVVIPYIKTEENLKILPKYTAALNRSKEEYLPAEDLDFVQLELELLLSSAAQRFRILKSEYDTLDKEDRRDKRNKFVEKSPTSPGKRKRVEDRKSKDRLLPSFKIAKKRQIATKSPVQSQNTDDSFDALPHAVHVFHKDQNKPATPKNDIPNKFWLSVEPYCMPISNEDLKLLEELLEQYSGPMVPPIPELGHHYTRLWSADDIKEDKGNSNISPKTLSRHMIQNHDSNAVLKKGEKLMGQGVTGIFTQRLVSVLMEEKLIDDFPETEANSAVNSMNLTNLRSASIMKNGIGIEKKLKKELRDHGILDAADTENQEDEVLSEIKRVTAELSATADYNNSAITKLQTVVREELERLELKRKLDALDQEIIESYKKVLTAKQKRRILTSQEKDEICQLTEEQKRLSDLLENVEVPGPKFLESS